MYIYIYIYVVRLQKVNYSVGGSLYLVAVGCFADFSEEYAAIIAWSEVELTPGQCQAHPKDQQYCNFFLHVGDGIRTA